MDIRAQTTSIYYFFPDSPSSNLKQLKGDVEKMFSDSSLPIIFQPFARLSDFDREIKDKPPDFLISPTWYTRENRQFNSLLKAYRKGKPSYVKLLITNSRLKLKANFLTGKSLAVTNMGRNKDNAWLKYLLGPDSEFRLEETNIIEVVKDVDAIFAVALMQVDVALVSKSTMDILKKINPRIIKSIQVIAESKPLPMPELFHFVGKSSEQKMEFLTEFMKSVTGSNENAFEKLLLIDEWRAVK